MPLAAVCPIHGVFPSRMIDARGGKVTVSRSSESCPECGRPSRTVEGTFIFDEHGIAEVMSAPEWSVAALDAVQGQLIAFREVVRDTSVSDERLRVEIAYLREAMEAQTEISTAMAENFSQLVASGVVGKPRREAFGFVSAVISLLASIKPLIEDGIWTYEHVRPLVEKLFS